MYCYSRLWLWGRPRLLGSQYSSRIFGAPWRLQEVGLQDCDWEVIELLEKLNEDWRVADYVKVVHFQCRDRCFQDDHTAECEIPDECNGICRRSNVRATPAALTEPASAQIHRLLSPATRTHGDCEACRSPNGSHEATSLQALKL